MAGIHRHFCGDVPGELVPADSFRIDHAPRGVLCAAGSARSGAGCAGWTVGDGSRCSSLVWDWTTDQRRENRTVAWQPRSLDRYQSQRTGAKPSLVWSLRNGTCVLGPSGARYPHIDLRAGWNRDDADGTVSALDNGRKLDLDSPTHGGWDGARRGLQQC